MSVHNLIDPHQKARRSFPNQQADPSRRSFSVGGSLGRRRIDFLPALLTGLLALSTAVWKKPILGLVMAGVIPISILLTHRQLISQKGIRLRLMRLRGQSA